ncbi:MAG: isochorismatase family protein [Prevotella sp.]|jgi:nicotinamidase/pyrazinamidase|nr:isochorismatase family protein [Prevotella sp.]
MEQKMLLIVDPQIDFITGSLQVPGAAEAMTRLAAYVRNHDEDYAVRIVTSDWHPYRHCSFQHEGGQWPTHCVQHSAGAAIWQPLLEALNESRGGYTLLYKGDAIDKDEYSILQNDRSADILLRLIKALGIAKIDICGLAGNVCVLNTAKDLAAATNPNKIHVLTDYAPSLDDGSELHAFIESLH